jgi:alcohol dehydrogenase
LIFSENKIIYESRLLPELLIGKTISVEEAPQALMNMNKFENLDDMVINSF